MVGLLVSLFLVFSGLSATRAQDDVSRAACNGDFDFYLLLDTSTSVRPYFADEVVPFVQQLVDSYSNPKLRISFITFDDEQDVILQLPLTSDRTAMQAAIENLKTITIIGRTFLAPAIARANSLIGAGGEPRASVLLTVTDGALDDPSNAATASTNAENLGATIATIGIGDVVTSQLRAVATYDSLVYVSETASGLSALVEQIARITCLEVKKVAPNPACRGQVMTVSGSGLNNTKDPTAAICRFTRNGQPSEELVTAATPKGYFRLTCPLPQFNVTGDFEGSWTFQFSLNGKSYSTATEDLRISNCSGVTVGQPPNSDAGLGVGLFLLIVAIIAAIAGCILLWLFFPCITGKIVGGLPPEEPKPVPEARPPKKWATVDASYYGGGGVGGIKPVTVRWGDKGATEEGNKLQKAKDAQVLAVHETPGYQPPVETPPTCWDIFKARVVRAYRWVSSYRIYRGRTKRLVWCPGPNSA